VASDKSKRVALYAVALAVAMLPAVYLAITHSEPYGLARKFVSGHPVVEAQIGSVKGVRLALSGNHSVIYGGTSGTASLELVVTGERGAGLAAIELQKELDTWGITAAKFRRAGEGASIETLAVAKPSD